MSCRKLLFMKNVLICFSSVFFLLLNVSCEDTDEIVFNGGRYEGNFYRFHHDNNYNTASVSLIINDNKFGGSSDMARYPVICEGTYEVVGHEIVFVNTCGPWTADFDWSLILGGSFEISYKNDLLILTRTYEFGFYDRYELRKK